MVKKKGRYDYVGPWYKQTRTNVWTGKKEKRYFRIKVRPSGKIIKETTRIKIIK